MTMTHLKLACVVVSLLSAPGLAQSTAPSTAPSTRPAEFDALAEQLGSPDAKTRDAAQAKIVKLGQAALDAVKELAENTPDPEVKARAEAILRKFSGPSVTEPTLVSLNFTNARAADVYAELFRQAKQKVDAIPPNLFADGRGPQAIPPVTVALDDVPFWVAILELERQTGITVDDGPGNGMRLTRDWHRFPQLERPGEERLEAFVSGPFMVRADDRMGGGMMLHRIKVYVEPRLRVVGHAMHPTILEVADANGNPIPRGPAEQQFAQMRARAGRQFNEFGGNAFDLHLMGPVKAGGRVRGTVKVVIAAGVQVVEIDGVAKANNVERVVDGRRVLLNAMNPDPGEWFITVVAYNLKPGTAGLSKTGIELFDRDGNALTLGGRGMNSDGDRIACHLNVKQAANIGPPATLRLTFPADTREIDIPFELGRKVALPKVEFEVGEKPAVVRE